MLFISHEVEHVIDESHHENLHVFVFYVTLIVRIDAISKTIVLVKARQTCLMNGEVIIEVDFVMDSHNNFLEIKC